MTFVYRKLVLFGASAALCIVHSFAVAQTSSIPQAQISDQGVVPPVSIGVLGEVDPKALAEVTAHLAVVGSAPWLGMQSTGQITLADGKTSYPATFSTMGSDRYRLDTQTTKGTESIRLSWLTGKIQDGTGSVTALPTGAAAAGIFPFQIVRSARFPSNQTSLIDHGIVTASGLQLHRLTVEKQTIGRNPVTKLPQTVAIDLYFDPATHLLVKSATSETAGAGHSASFLRVVTYDDYRRVGPTLIPFRYYETIDGEPYQSLQLSEVQLAPTFDATYFHF